MTLLASFASTVAVIAAIGSASAETITFGDAQLGALPKEFVSALTGDGSNGRWEVIDDTSAESNRALAQLSEQVAASEWP